MEKVEPEFHNPDQGDEEPAPRKGFHYHVSQEQIEEYRTWPYARRLEWLLACKRLRQAMPRRIIEI